jgi:hypothetical protein
VILQLIGQNPKAQMLQAAMMGHIAEHVGYGYRQKIEQQLGMALPPEDEKLPPEIEIALSGMMAQAAQQVLQQNKAAAAKEQAQQQAQDPILQLQQQELQIKMQELELKKQKMQIEAAGDADELKLKERQIEGNLELEGMKVAIDMQKSKEKLAADQERDGVRMGIDIAKSRAQARNKGTQ